MRVHVIGIPHTATSKEYTSCAFTQKVLNMCKMLHDEGHYVIHYGNEGSWVCANELVTILSKQEICTPENALYYDTNSDMYIRFNVLVAANILSRLQERDFIFCAWPTHKAIVDLVRGGIVVESGIGYASGHFAPFKVFESYAMMHMYYGLSAVERSGKLEWYSRVIPNFFDVHDFEYSDEKYDYLLFMGMRHGGISKGYEVAVTVAKEVGIPLHVAGPDEPPKDAPSIVKYVGLLDVESRKEQLAHARALIAPSLFAEPFCGAQVEAFLSGTPVISTDWGAFTEYNLHGVTGYRCHTLREFVEAVEHIDQISSLRCRRHGEQFTLEAVRRQYTAFMQDIMTCYTGKGWYSM